MAQLPLYFNGTPVDLNQLAGYNYVAGFPELMQLLWRHNQDTMMGYTQQGTFIYPLPGRQRIYAAKGRSWKPGQRLRAFRAGNTGDWRIINILSYNPLNGLAYIEVVGTSLFESAGMGGTAYFMMPYFTDMAQSVPLPVANGGLGGDSIDSIRQALQLPTNRYYATFFTDFIKPVSFCRLSNGTSADLGVALPVQDSAGTLSDDFSAHPGLYNLSVSTTGDRRVAFGRPAIGPWTDFSGDNTYFECAWKIPSLSSSGNFVTEVGLIGTQAKIIVSYTDNVNTGRFTVVHGINGGTTTISTTLVVAINTWYKMSMAVSGANIVVNINGVTANVPKANYQGVTSTNRMTPTFRLNKPSAGNGTAYIDYMYFRKHFPNGR